MGVDMYLYCNSKEISQAVAQELYRNDDTLHQNCWSNGMIGYWHNQHEINNWFKINTEEYKDGCGIYNVDGLALYKLYGNVCRALEERDYKLFPQEWSYRLGRQKSFWDALEDTRNILEVIFDNIYVDAKGKCHDKSDLSWNVKFTYIVSW